LLSYNIEGITESKASVDELSDFDRLFLQVNTLYAKKNRLEAELVKTVNEIKQLEGQINNCLINKK